MVRRTPLFLCALLVFAGCDARIEAEGRFSARISTLIGTFDLGRQRAEEALLDAEKALHQLTRGRIAVQVQAARIGDDLAAVKAEIDRTDTELARLRNLITGGEDAVIAGTTYTPDQLKRMASRKTSTRRNLLARAGSLRKTKQSLRKTKQLDGLVSMMSAREQERRDQLANLRMLIAEVAARSATLKAVQEATDAADFDISAVEQEVENLAAKLDTGLSFAWNGTMCSPRASGGFADD